MNNKVKKMIIEDNRDAIDVDNMAADIIMIDCVNSTKITDLRNSTGELGGSMDIWLTF